MIHELRPYQQQALDEIRAKYSQGIKKVLLWMPTGSGKTTVFSKLLGGAVAKGKRAVMVVAGVQLVDQASRRLFREGIDHGVMQGNHWNKNPSAPIQVCSIDTLYARKTAPEADLLVIDEVHMAQRGGYHWLIEQYDQALFVLGVTATPFVKRGLRHVADDYIRPVRVRELVRDGYLAKCRYFVPSSPDMENVEIDQKTGDYKAKPAAERMSAVNGDIVESYKKYLNGAPSVLFAVDVKHSEEMRDRLLDAGVKAAHVEADTPKTKREEVFKDLASGECQVVCNVGVLTTGWDLPELRGVIMARPTRSYNLFVQMWGRGTRSIPGVKSDFILIDHACNLVEHGFPENEPDLDLDGKPKRDAGEQPPIICSQCLAAFDRHDENPETRLPTGTVCPYCGHNNKHLKDTTKLRKKDEQAADFLEIDPDDPLAQADFDCSRWIRQAINRGYKPGWVWYRIKEAYDEQTADCFKRRIWKEVPNPASRP